MRASQTHFLTAVSLTNVTPETNQGHSTTLSKRQPASKCPHNFLGGPTLNTLYFAVLRVNRFDMPTFCTKQVRCLSSADTWDKKNKNDSKHAVFLDSASRARGCACPTRRKIATKEVADFLRLFSLH